MPSVGIGQRLAMLWLVVALLVQGVVTQSHVHFGATRLSAPAGLTIAAPVTAERQNPAPVAPVCPLCEEKALFGAYLLTGTILLVAPLDEAYRPLTATLSSLSLRLPSHAWRSRAPPLSTI